MINVHNMKPGQDCTGRFVPIRSRFNGEYVSEAFFPYLSTNYYIPFNLVSFRDIGFWQKAE